MRTTKIGFLSTGNIFIYQGRKYKAGHAIYDTNGYVACTDVETNKVKRLHIDLDVEVE